MITKRNANTKNDQPRPAKKKKQTRKYTRRCYFPDCKNCTDRDSTRVPSIPKAPEGENVSKRRWETYQKKLQTRREFLVQMGLPQDTTNKEMRICKSHALIVALPKRNLETTPSPDVLQETPRQGRGEPGSNSPTSFKTTPATKGHPNRKYSKRCYFKNCNNCIDRGSMRVPSIPKAPEGENISKQRWEVYQNKLQTRRDFLCRIGLPEDTTVKDMRICKLHALTFKSPEDNLDTMPSPTVVQEAPLQVEEPEGHLEMTPSPTVVQETPLHVQEEPASNTPTPVKKAPAKKRKQTRKYTRRCYFKGCKNCTDRDSTRVPSIPKVPEGENISKRRWETYQRKLEIRRDFLVQMGLPEDTTTKEMRICKSHALIVALPKRNLETTPRQEDEVANDPPAKKKKENRKYSKRCYFKNCKNCIDRGSTRVPSIPKPPEGENVSQQRWENYHKRRLTRHEFLRRIGLPEDTMIKDMRICKSHSLVLASQGSPDFPWQI